MLDKGTKARMRLTLLTFFCQHYLMDLSFGLVEISSAIDHDEYFDEIYTHKIVI